MTAGENTKKTSGRLVIKDLILKITIMMIMMIMMMMMMMMMMMKTMMMTTTLISSWSGLSGGKTLMVHLST